MKQVLGQIEAMLMDAIASHQVGEACKLTSQAFRELEQLQSELAELEVKSFDLAALMEHLPEIQAKAVEDFAKDLSGRSFEVSHSSGKLLTLLTVDGLAKEYANTLREGGA